MSRKARALSSPKPDETSVSPTPAQAWVKLFGCPTPRLDALVAQAVAWQQQRLVHGDIPFVIARDLALISAEAGALRNRSAAQPVATGAPRTDTAREVAPARENVPSISAPITAAPVIPAPKGASRAGTAAGSRRTRGGSPLPTPTRRASAAPLPPASSQLLVGTRLVKTHGGQTHVVEVTADGMFYAGELFSSLSAVAKRITGTHWNGLLFFGLRRRKTYPAKAAANG